jgi:hypothetical protein
LLQFLGACLQEGNNWASVKHNSWKNIFRIFCERIIRDLIVFNFQAKGQPLRVYIDQGFQAADFFAVWGYRATVG